MTALAPTTTFRSKTIARYLLVYNVLSSAGWAYALGGTVAHIVQEYRKSEEISTLTKLKTAGRSVYASGMGKFVLALEGMAIQEIVQARKGWVATSTSTVASQTFARLFVLVYIVERSKAAQNSAGYAMMVCVWALAECIRYPYYTLLYLSQGKSAASATGRLTALFQYLWYTAFMFLYPLGVGGGEFILFAKKIPSLNKFKASSIGEKLDASMVTFALLLWPKGVWDVYSHMLTQRKKVLGT